jgi:hypothetical protein
MIFEGGGGAAVSRVSIPPLREAEHVREKSWRKRAEKTKRKGKMNNRSTVARRTAAKPIPEPVNSLRKGTENPVSNYRYCLSTYILAICITPVPVLPSNLYV